MFFVTKYMGIDIDCLQQFLSFLRPHEMEKKYTVKKNRTSNNTTAEWRTMFCVDKKMESRKKTHFFINTNIIFNIAIWFTFHKRKSAGIRKMCSKWFL